MRGHHPLPDVFRDTKFTGTLFTNIPRKRAVEPSKQAIKCERLLFLIGAMTDLAFRDIHGVDRL